MFFGWLRAQVKNAVLGGIADAVQEIAPDDTAADGDALAQLRRRMTPALPAPSSVAPTTAPAEPPVAGQEATEPAAGQAVPPATRNGRRRPAAAEG